MRKFAILSAFLFSLLLLSACSNSAAPASDAGTTPPAEDSGSMTAPADEPEAADVSVGDQAKIMLEEESNDPPASGSPDPVQESVAEESPAASAPSVKSFTMTAKQWEFIPSTITVNAGDTVKLTITSTDVEHGIAIPEFGVNQSLAPGETVTVQFVADKAGTYTFFCNVFCGHDHRSMRGTLIVQ